MVDIEGGPIIDINVILPGLTGEQFILREEDASGVLLSSKYALLQQEIAVLVGVTSLDVIIYAVVDSDVNTIDVIYAVQNPYGQYYRPSKINGLIWANKDQVLLGRGYLIIGS